MSGAYSTSSSTNVILLKKATYLLQQGCGYRPAHVPPKEGIFDKTNISAYRFIASTYYPIYGFFLCIIQFSLCFLEPNSLLLHSANPPILSLQWCLCIELYCIFMHFAALYLSYRSLGCIRPQITLYWYFCGISTFSILLTFIFPSSIFRIYRFLRPAFPFIYFSLARMWKDMVLSAFGSVLKLIIFGTLFITIISSILVFSLYNKRSLSHYPNLKNAVDQLSEFNSLPPTMLHMFLYSAGLNTPNLWSVIYRYNPLHCILWICLIVIMYQLLQNILLAAICEQYTEIESEVVLKRVRKIKHKILKAYELLIQNNANGDFVTKKQMKYIFNNFNFQQHSSLYDASQFEIFWLYSNDEANRHIVEEKEFRSFCLTWFSTFHLEYKHNTNSSITNFFEKKIISSTLSLADCIFSVYAVMQTALLLYRLNASDLINTEWIVVVLDLSNILWIMEVLLRIYVLGFWQYIYSRHIFNGIVTVIIVSLQIINTSLVNFKYLSVDDDLHILRLGFTIICWADIDRKFHEVLYSTGHAIRQVIVFLFIVMLFQIALALLGLELFANILENIKEHSDEDGAYSKWSGLGDDDKSFNFDTFLNGFNLVYIIFNENGFTNYMFYYMDQTQFATVSFVKRFGAYIVLSYFIFAYVAQVMFLCNLLTSIFLTNYEFHVQHWVDSQTLKKIRNAVMNKLQASADIVSPNTYVVSYWLPLLHSNHVADLDQFLEIR